MTKTADDAAYDTPYNNIQYTSSTSGGNQIWTASSSILLTGTKANVYAYYPYDANYNDITKISIDVTENKDVMWATPVTNIYNASPTAPLSMNHALSVIRFSLSKGDYSGTGSIESISIQGDCMAKTCKLNAKTGEVSITDQGAEIDFGTLGAAANLSTTATTVEQLVIPTTTSGPIKVTIKMDGKTFEAISTASFTLVKSKAYKFGLVFTDSKLTMSDVSIGAITEVSGEDMTPIINRNPWANFTTSNDGVYGIDADGKPLTYDEATAAASLNGVAIVMYGRAMQISNNQLIEQIWGDTKTDIVGIDNLTVICSGVSGDEGFLPKADGTYYNTPHITESYDLWPSTSNTALADTAGWNHTKVLIEKQSNSSHLGPKTKAFRGNSSVNQGYEDWYVPAEGQLAYMYLKVTEINALLSKCGGTQIPLNWHRSSSEYGAAYAWSVLFSNGQVSIQYATGAKTYYSWVRFCRYLN